MIAEQPSLTENERPNGPMYHNERIINMLSATDNNLNMICLLILRDLVLNLGFFFFFFFFFYSHCILSSVLPPKSFGSLLHCLE